MRYTWCMTQFGAIFLYLTWGLVALITVLGIWYMAARDDSENTPPSSH